MNHKFTTSGINIINGIVKENTFPLFTKQALADRWKVSRQLVNEWSKRRKDFCKPIDGIVAGGGPYYPLYEVERYERERKIKNDL